MYPEWSRSVHDDCLGSGSDKSSDHSENEEQKFHQRPNKKAKSTGGIKKFQSNNYPMEKIQKKGLRGLNLTPDYCAKSGWGVEEGIRELLQNLYVYLIYMTL